MVNGLLSTLALIIGGPVSVLILHEATHYTAARLVSSAQLQVETLVPPRFRLDFDTDSTTVIRIVGVAPTLVGLMIAPIALISGVWAWLDTLSPYYFRRIVLAYWLLYTAPSPADLRVMIWADEAKNRPLYWLRSKLGLED